MTKPRYLLASYPEHQSAIRAVRQAVFVDEQGIDPALEWDSNDETAVYVLAFVGVDCVGTARLLPTGKIGRMAVLKPWRSRGIGSHLLKTLLQHAKEMGLKNITLSSQIQVCDFYRRFNFEKTGPVFTEAGIPHQAMYRIL